MSKSTSEFEDSLLASEEKALYIEHVVAWNVRMLLAAKKLSQTALSNALGIQKATMSKKINGSVSWSLTDLVKAADYLGTTPVSLMDDTLMKQMTSPSTSTPQQGALVGAGSPRYLVSPYNADGSLSLDSKDVVLGGDASRNKQKSAENVEKSGDSSTVIMPF